MRPGPDPCNTVPAWQRLPVRNAASPLAKRNGVVPVLAQKAQMLAKRVRRDTESIQLGWATLGNTVVHENRNLGRPLPLAGLGACDRCTTPNDGSLHVDRQRSRRRRLYNFG